MLAPLSTSGSDCKTISPVSGWIQCMSTRRPDSFIIWMERAVSTATMIVDVIPRNERHRRITVLAEGGSIVSKRFISSLLLFVARDRRLISAKGKDVKEGCEKRYQEGPGYGDNRHDDVHAELKEKDNEVPKELKDA
mmetsp:Transcript_13978/g.30352  ORF Transcript_13978/g.30352 Transcript_13978/m.30352 type:complete len:137 (-) Transcript_13978:136-546(-)